MVIERKFTDLEWLMTPEPVRRQFVQLEQIVNDLTKRIEKLEVQVGMNSKNSSKPPSSDSPYKKVRRKKQDKKKKRAKGAKKGHKGHQQQLLKPTDKNHLLPGQCSCGHQGFSRCETTPFYTHQHVELPVIDMEITHWVLHKCDCPVCGKTVKASLPENIHGGYGPRLCAFIAELSGTKGMSRRDVQQLIQSVLNIPIATGTIQKIVDRSSEAILPVYEMIGNQARRSWCNYVDETSWFNHNELQWLWAMVNERVALYRVDAHRSKKAFEELVQDWQGILISDSYNLYRSWVYGRQTCLAHLIRKGDALAERKKRDLRLFGQCMASHLRQLVRFSKDPPDSVQWSEFYTYLMFTLSLWEGDKTDAGQLARQVQREMDALWTFLDHEGIEPTNNRAERALRSGVLWRKRSLGTQSEKGKRWVERVLSLKETCRLRATSTFAVLEDCLRSYFNNSKPDLSWI